MKESSPQPNEIQVSSLDGQVFDIEPWLWQRNCREQSLLLRYFALPLQEDQQRLWLGLDSLDNLNACEVFAFLHDKSVEPVILDNSVLKSALQQLTVTLSDGTADQLQDYAQAVYRHDIPTEPAESRDEPVIQLLETIFEQALAQRASDIHFEPVSQPKSLAQLNTQALQVRFRVDGVLTVNRQVGADFASRLISRVKLLAHLDIAETRLPQDGRFQFTTAFNDVLDFRLSILPTQLGEKAVLRLQQNKPVELAFSELGMTKQQQHCFQQALRQPQGLILVTGPTGSGKSISLYTALHSLNQPEKHIVTAEDPIEISLQGIVQTQINPAIGLDFKQLLRTFLRQDPDVIMLGEIRDEESAQMAIRAAQTGHLVLSTLHTNDAPAAIGRLQQLGVPEYELASCLLLVIAQRLLRRRCECRQVGQDSCGKCHQGYYGRIGTYQFLQPHFFQSSFAQPHFNDKTNRHLPTVEYQLDFDSLYHSGIEKVRSGVTDLAEIQRVLGDGNGGI
ncbi:type II/IV secretion system protein [Testudinibacter sp. TR-2022]|uniref:GspE/PulE family protein n=1 Tax=Testudinibacter sp. TR-2022 TaxID=2585029 RepID=UPI001119BF6A|nr:GspE/PulE family protein [Testudinibacter sp. TR-2022]TNH05464.1 type II/IV secretion system protein [Pasteurellaceae bacterium Phil31]TNH07161.1 type II/IV secretion system protein [Testudinibacter sp. TR-2022]TNH11141.1 type II/IV secretion system protein [Testudinibacter sp. TR-2022]TNH13362.1 type II/IV secretion system protein [Testudinibacter sp. TR-2022]TNH16321.1 type II/IV secretion system protein [Testudinibacter sp. TR-2022]